jgi:hypothetical protein
MPGAQNGPLEGEKMAVTPGWHIPCHGYKILSRYKECDLHALLACEELASTRAQFAFGVFERVFKESGFAGGYPHR